MTKQNRIFKEIRRRKAFSLILIFILATGLIATVMLLKNAQDLRQNASGESVQLKLSTNSIDVSSPHAFKPNETVSVLVEVVPGEARVSAADFILTYDSSSYDYVATELFESTFGVLLQKEINPTDGKVHLALGRKPPSAQYGNQKMVRVTFRAKNKVGTTQIGIEAQTAKIAALGSAINVYQGPTSPIDMKIVGGDSGPKTSIQLKFKLAGIPVENNPSFLPESARIQPVKISLQNMETGAATIPTSLSSIFIKEQTTPSLISYFSFINPFTVTDLSTGKYNILLKGPKHQQIRFCKNDQDADYRCQITDSIEITKDASHTFDFTKRPLSCGDLPISGTNHDQQDGAVRVTDYSFMVSCLSKRTDAACVTRADCNEDGSVTNLDMDLLLETLSTAYDQ
ncbi:MAG: hypothetical protein COY80_00520 [Candidatus Pacebacteria bacterium CG_4_10_14_0_8_um_filter_42_14]|nr:MAG: hypothetical protein COY80_00520 [Candidatus Pacebacteria bacterium CG_4_10_14_0_8_um_filter_42_14]